LTVPTWGWWLLVVWTPAAVLAAVGLGKLIARRDRAARHRR
jgi:hypothetical protein